MQDFNLREVANSLWAMTTASRVLSEVCDSLCNAAAAKVLGVSGSGSEGEGFQLVSVLHAVVDDGVEDPR